MKINAFEGARRIAILIGAIGTVTAIGIAWNSEPFLYFNYQVNGPGLPPFKVETCGSDGRNEYFDRMTPKRRKLNIELCFPPSRSDSGQMLIPYKTTNDGKWWMGEEYSSEVASYVSSVASNFELPPADGAEADKLFAQKKFDNRWDSVKYSFLGVCCLWLITALVGWIVRGFCGIHYGKDMVD
jgi:hypothetical protein